MINGLPTSEAPSASSNSDHISSGAFSIVYAYGGAAYGSLAINSGVSELFATDDPVYARSTRYVLWHEMGNRTKNGNILGSRVCRYVNADDIEGDPRNDGIKFFPAGITIASPDILADPEVILHGAFFNDKIRHQFAKVATELGQVNS